MDPGGWKSKWLTRGSAETKIQTSLVGLLILSSAGLVSLLLSGEIFLLPLNGRYRNSILLPVLHISLVAETTNLNLSYSVTLLQPRSSRINEVLVGVSEPMDCSCGFATPSGAIKSQLPHIFQFGSDPFFPPGRHRQAPVRSTVGLFTHSYG